MLRSMVCSMVSHMASSIGLARCSRGSQRVYFTSGMPLDMSHIRRTLYQIRIKIAFLRASNAYPV